MDYEVVVVGGGIGGLTTAALLAARGVKVCLFERQSRPGGCVANLEHLGYEFEPTFGLYSGWQAGGVYEKLFSALKVNPPEITRLSPAYLVRLPDQTEVSVSENLEQFERALRHVFPECHEAALSFYREMAQVAESRDRFPEVHKWLAETTGSHLTETSSRFRRFIDAQLQAFVQCPSDECSWLYAALALTAPRRGMWAIRGGAQTLADVLAESLKLCGGVVRLDSPVLRLAYGSDGAPIGVDLLSGERITATRAIVSNLTIWDTYGKLIGISRTPASISLRLRQMRGPGAYLLFLGLDQTAGSRLPAERVLALTDWQESQPFSPEAQLMFAAAPQSDSRAPAGKRAVTVSTFTDAEEWFAYHESEEAHEEQDQERLNLCWERLHAAMPELGDAVEVIETATPRTFYETTRRKFGMVGGLCPSPSEVSERRQYGTTVFPNVFLVGDTACSGSGLAAVCESALTLAETLLLR